MSCNAKPARPTEQLAMRRALLPWPGRYTAPPWGPHVGQRDEGLRLSLGSIAGLRFGALGERLHAAIGPAISSDRSRRGARRRDIGLASDGGAEPHRPVLGPAAGAARKKYRLQLSAGLPQPTATGDSRRYRLLLGPEASYGTAGRP
jgi:hypothetical protein